MSPSRATFVAGFAALVMAAACTSFEPAVDAGPTGTVVIVPSSAEFGTVVIGNSSAPAELMLVGTGETAALALGSTDSSYQIVDDDCTGKQLIEGQVCTASVVFAPTGAGTTQGELTVLDKSAQLSGDGLMPGALTVTPANADFAEVQFGGTPGTLSLTIENTGVATVAGVTAELDGDSEFTITGGACGDLAATQTCTVEMLFTPTASGGRLASLRVNGDGVLQSAVSVSGVGTAPIYEVAVDVNRDNQISNVTSDVGGINCPDGECTAQVEFMSTIVLSANGPDFLTWTGDCQGQQGRICTLPIDGPKTTLAVFADIPF